MKTLTLRVAVAGVSLVLGISFLGVGGCSSKPKTPEQRAALSASLLEPLPPPARLALERITGGAGVSALVTDEFEGRNVYSADYLTADNMKGHAQVTSDGRVLSNYVESKKLTFGDAPEPVKTAVRSRTGGANVRDVMVERQVGGSEGDAANRYTVNADLSGMKHKYVFDYTGALLSEGTQIRAEQLPPAAGAAIDRRFPGLLKGTIWEVRDSKGAVSYAAEGRDGDRKIRTVVSTAGVVQSVSYMRE